jgi:hypothetical protein
MQANAIWWSVVQWADVVKLPTVLIIPNRMRSDAAHHHQSQIGNSQANAHGPNLITLTVHTNNANTPLTSIRQRNFVQTLVVDYARQRRPEITALTAPDVLMMLIWYGQVEL